MKKICQLCGTEYEAKGSRSKYCYKPVIKKCKACGKEFETQCFKGNPEYCSHSCASSVSPKDLVPLTCPICGDKFTRTNANQKYCMHTKEAICKVCGKPFTYICTQAARSSKFTCGDDKCRAAYAHQRSAAYYTDKTVYCKVCGLPFTPTTNASAICDREHKFKCVICSSEFTIPKKYLTEPKLRQTCSDECKRKLMSQNNKGSTEESVAKRKATCLERYGVEHAAQSPIIQQKMHQTYQSRTGFTHPSHNPEVRSRSAKSARTSKLELKICTLLDNYNIEYKQHYMLNADDVAHEFDFYLPKYKILIDADGVYYHSYLSDPDGVHSIDYYDDIRISLVPEDYQFHVIVEGTEEKAVKEIVKIIHPVDADAFNYDSYLFDWCRSIGFPYPQYDDTRMQQDWQSLCKYSNDVYVPQCRIGESLISNYHRSIYNCRVKHYSSPVEAWNDDTKLKKVIQNRLIYVNNVDPSKILRGFNVSKICPRVSIFNPILAKYIVTKYLAEFNQVFDPFSGFSGRLLGTIAAGKEYIGQDLNPDTVAESNQIIDFLQLSNASIIQKDIFDSFGKYECLLTCPPYHDKETYKDESVFLSCDDWIDECLNRFDCKKYAFVVDKTEKYKDYVVEELKSTSHFNTVKETIVVISK